MPENYLAKFQEKVFKNLRLFRLEEVLRQNPGLKNILSRDEDNPLTGSIVMSNTYDYAKERVMQTVSAFYQARDFAVEYIDGKVKAVKDAEEYLIDFCELENGSKRLSILQ